MDVVIENYIFNNLSSFIHACLRIYVVSSALLRSLVRLCFIAKGAVTVREDSLLRVRGEASDLEKNYPDIY